MKQSLVLCQLSVETAKGIMEDNGPSGDYLLRNRLIFFYHVLVISRNVVKQIERENAGEKK